MNSIHNFWGLLTDFKVEIPIIQRDYAQGRADKKTTEIRKRFIYELMDKIHEGKPIHLDFIYGKVSNGVLHLLDGQQRITTLFLLHLYLINRLSDANSFNKERKTLKKFTYKTRSSAEEFCLFLTDSTLETECQTEFSEGIKNHPAFYTYWEKDPTVQAMLHTLDTIHEEAKESLQQTPDIEIFCRETNPFQFHFLNMGDHQLSDDLYIRMNGRGKHLTDWENFKAWLYEQNYVGVLNLKFRPYSDGEEADWKDFIDKEWTDYIWENSVYETDPKETQNKALHFDYCYYTFFKEVGLHGYLCQDEKPSLSEDEKKKQANLIRVFQSEEYIPEEHLKEVFSKSTCYVVKSLNLLQKREKESAKFDLRLKYDFSKAAQPIIKQFLSKTRTLQTRLLFHSFLEYLHQSETDSRLDELDHWMRVARNLIVNSSLSSENFGNMLRSLKTLCKELHGDVYPILQSLSLNEERYPGVNKNQLKEEVLKAKLIMSQDDSGWEQAIITAENKSLLEGEIHFLLLDPQNDLHINQFKKRAQIFGRLFDDNGYYKTDDSCLIFRAALVHSEEIKLQSQQSISFKNSKTEWKHFLGHVKIESPDGKFQKGLLKLIENISNDAAYNTQEIEKILFTKCQDPSIDDDWIDDLIKYGHIFMKWGKPWESEDWWNSRDNKVQNYYDAGIFVYHKDNVHEHDIMIGKIGRWRNLMISQMLDNKSWGIDQEWITRNIIKISDTNFYKGHNIHFTHSSKNYQIHFHGKRMDLLKTNQEIDTPDMWENADTVYSVRYPEDQNLLDLRANHTVDEIKQTLAKVTSLHNTSPSSLA